MLADLRSGFGGSIFTPDDAGYEGVRRIWNASVVRKPAIIAVCSSVSDVVAGVNYARRNQLLTAIRGGGHNVGGRALCDDGLVIDLSGMREVQVDPESRRVRVQGGARLSDLDQETQKFGLAVPVGIVPKTGVAGLTLGGGVGWLVRKYGMSIDNLISCQVVTADGEIVMASADENPDLFWALRGGGGNFGVVVNFEFQAHPVSTVLGGILLYPRSVAFDVIRNFRDFIEAAPDELTAYAALMHTPDGTPVVGVIPCWCGDLDEGQRILKPLRDFGSPLLDAVQPMPFSAMQSLLADAFPDGNQNYWKAAMMPSLNDEAIRIAIDCAGLASSPLSAVVFEHYGGAAGRVSSTATAFPHREMTWHALVLAQWREASESSKHQDWARTAYAALRRFSEGAQLLGVLDSDEVSAGALGSNLPRLASVKARYDPTNFFRVNQNILPA